MDKDTKKQSIDFEVICNKKPSKTVSIKKKGNNTLPISSFCRALSFSIQMPSNFVPHPKGIKVTKSPTPLFLNTFSKNIMKPKRSFKQEKHDELYLSFEEVPSDVDSDEDAEDDNGSIGQDTIASEGSLNSYRRHLSIIRTKQCGDDSNSKSKDSGDGIFKRKSLFKIDKEEIIPLCRRLSVQYIKKPNKERGYSILDMLELSNF